jgi:cytochrome c-type biogenesis protein CcmH/NrfG
MEDPSTSARIGWQAKQVYVLAAICLILGVTLGYLVRGSAAPQVPPTPAATAMPIAAPDKASPAGETHPRLSLEQMKHMADKQAEPLLAKLQKNPNDAALLIQVGNIYRSTHQFKEATDYYGKSLQVDPTNVRIRTEMASCLYYTGEVDKALQQLQLALQTDPKDPNSLFNLGLIKWREKKDPGGALSAWQQLLKSNPKLDPGKKSQVQKLMAEVKQQNAIKN